MDETSIRDEHLEHLARCKGLEELRLCGTDISDEGLRRLRHDGALRHLALERTRVTPEGIGALLRALPDCRVEY